MLTVLAGKREFTTYASNGVGMEKTCTVRHWLQRCQDDLEHLRDGSNTHAVNNALHVVRFLREECSQCERGQLAVCPFIPERVAEAMKAWGMVSNIAMKKFRALPKSKPIVDDE